MILSIEDKDTIQRLYDYCIENNITIDVDDIVVNDIDTGLRNFVLSIENRKTPGYDYYIGFYMNMTNSIEESALLYVLSLFYNIPVLNNKGNFYFVDGITPFYVRRDKLKTYQDNFQILIGKKLVSYNPLIKALLKPDSLIKRFKNYNVWYADYRDETKYIEDKLFSLIEEGYFIPNKYNQERIKLFKFESLDLYPNAIRGPELFGTRLNSNVLDSSYIEVKVNYKIDRRTLAGCIMASLEEYCPNLVGCITCKEACNYIDCEEIMKIKTNEDSISLYARDFISLKNILEQTDIIARESISYEVKDIQEGIQFRIKLANIGVTSLLLDDEDGYYIVAFNYSGKDPTELPYVENNISEEELELYSSILDNYEKYGRNYAHIGIYSVPGTLPGILSNIPIKNYSSLNV